MTLKEKLKEVIDIDRDQDQDIQTVADRIEQKDAKSNKPKIN